MTVGLTPKLLASRDLPEIFKEICLQKLTGVFYAERLKYKRSVYFQNGSPIFATSNLSEDKIGKILFTRGKINMDQLMQALDRAKTAKKRLGSVLVELGHISPKDLFESVVFQVEQVLFSLFEQDWRDAKFAFDADAAFGDEVIKLSINPADVILEGIRRSYNPDIISHNVGSGKTIFEVTATRNFDIDKLKISPEEKNAYLFMDGRATLDEIIAESGAPKYKVQTLFYALKVLEFIQPRVPAAAAKLDGVASGVKFTAPKIEIDIEEEAVEEAVEEASLFEEIIPQPSDNLDFGDIELPIDVLTAPSPIPEAKPAVAKPVAPPAPKPAPKPAAETVTEPEPAKAATATGKTKIVSAKPAAAQATADELKALAARLRQQNYYQRLGVEDAAPASAIIAAYSALRKKYDTDLTPGLRTAGKVVIALIADGYKALAIEGNRAVYDALLAEGGAPSEVDQKFRLRMAQARFEEGKRAWDGQNFDEASKAFRESIELDPTRADYYFGLGLVLAAREEGAPDFQEVEVLFSKAAALQSDQPRGYYYLGTLFRFRGDMDKASESFKRALALDARYGPAQEGLKACAK